MKYSVTLLIVILFSNTGYAQDAYEKFYLAIVDGDTVLANKIEKENAHVTEPIEEMTFPIRNISEHVFPMRIQQLKDSIIHIFNHENQENNRFLKNIFYSYMVKNDTTLNNRIFFPFMTESSQKPLFGNAYFSQKNTSDDIYIHNFNISWPSKLYFSNGNQLEYHTAFIVKLYKINNDSTRVLIVSEDPKVINGIDGFGAHAPIARETSVPSSSIEEYSLLLYIADKLNEHDLQPLKLPGNK